MSQSYYAGCRPDLKSAAVLTEKCEKKCETGYVRRSTNSTYGMTYRLIALTDSSPTDSSQSRTFFRTFRTFLLAKNPQKSEKLFRSGLAGWSIKRHALSAP